MSSLASVTQLRTLLLSALSPRGLQNGEQEFFEELMAHKPLLTNLYDVGPRNAQEQRDWNRKDVAGLKSYSGKITVNGRPHAVNPDFARQTLFISQELDVSERHAANLLQHVMSVNPNVPMERCIEATILEFHTRRRHLADCLQYILEAAQLGEAGDVRSSRQNARSDTVAPTQGAQASLGADILTARCDSLKYERRTLAMALYFLGRMGFLAPNEVSKLIDWLDANPQHPMTFYILPTILAVFDIVRPDSNAGLARKQYVSDKGLMNYMRKKLDIGTEWKEPGLKATMLLKWTLFLAETRQRNPPLENAEGFKTEELETQIWNAVQGDCFTYLLRMIARLQKKHAAYPPTSFASNLLAQTEQDPSSELPAEEFKPAILEACELLIRSMIGQASSELRKIKQRQEDLLLAGARSGQTRAFRSSHAQPSARFAPGSSEADKPGAPPRNDMAVLFSLTGLLYSTLPPERALHFWGGGSIPDGRRSTYAETMEASSGKLPAFLNWAVWSTQPRDVDMLMALYDMLSGLATGQQCSELAYNFLARGGGDAVPGGAPASSSSAHLAGGPAVSWSAIFGLLDSWVTAGSAPRNNQAPPQMTGIQSGFGAAQQWQAPQPPQPPPQLAFTQQDVLLAQAFLRLLATVATHSVAVRVTISGHARFRAIPTLVSLVPLGIPLELKGSIFETLAAFCEPGAGSAGVEICRSVWVLMERMEVINVRVNTGFGGSLSTVKGVEVELEEVEAVYKMYPATIPFLKLLSTLIHTPKSIPLRDRVADAEPINTIPENFGQPYRQPGIGPFSSFVIDNVFSRINAREYLRHADRWRTNDLCLCFIERCLASYDLESLVTSTDELQPKGDDLLQLAVHPGFDIMKRLLTASTLQTNMLSYLVDGLDGLDRGFAEEEYFFRTTIVRVLRIIHRVLDIQDVFLDVFLPLLAELNDPDIGDVPHASYFTRFDQVLSYSPEHVPAVAAYVAYPAYPELVLLSVKILTALAASSSFTQLALLIERSAESDRILDGYVSIMDCNVLEDVDAAETFVEQSTGAGAHTVDEPSDALLQAIRLATLDFFIHNTHQNRPYPNIAHWLLFGGSAANNQIQDPHALGARRSCIHSILDLLNSGVPRMKGKGRERRQPASGDALFAVLPALAERCYHVMYELYFFARHLAAIPFKAPGAEREPCIEVVYNDGSRVVTTVPNIAAFLKLRSWIMDLIALELHVLVNKGHHKTVAELLELLFGNEGGYVEVGAEGWGGDIYRPFHEVGQSHLRMVEFLQSLDFDWSDGLTVQPMELQFLSQLNLQSCVRVNEDGCEIVDRTALLSLLASARKVLHTQSQIVTPTHLQQLTAEINYVLQSCAIENHRREVRFAAANAYEAWRRLLDMTLMKCFNRLPYDRREDMLFDLLHVMPLIMRSANTQESTAILLAEAMLSTITKLREDRHHQILLRSAGGDVEAGSLPAERLHALLRSILECIVDNSRVELVRGNLYASLVNYLHLVMSSNNGQDLDASGLDSSLTSSLSPDSLSAADGLAVGFPRSPAGATHISGTLSILKSVMERLVIIVSRDAIDGTEVWKTVAFMLLDSLVRLARWEKHTPTVLQALARHGFLAGFVSGLKESDSRLQAVLKPDPDDLNSLYVYEAKMSLLIRMSQSRQGAERLLESRTIPVLADCEYLDARPEADQAFMDHDSFLPSAVQRYHQLFLPALQLVSGILVTLGHRHTTAVNHALQFLSSHRDTLIILLKNEVDELSLAVIEEMRLIVSLCANVLHLVPKTELLSSSGFGGIHAAISGLATRCLGNGHWSEAVRPQSDAELVDAGITGSAYGTETRFRFAVHDRERLLRRALTAYLGAASEFTEPDITLVFSPIVTTPKEERTSRFLATVPTVGDAIEALNHLCDDLSSSIKRIADISAELNSKTYIRVENIEDIIPMSDPALLENLDMRQRQSLIARQLARWRTDAGRRAHVTLSSLEMLLLLLWRHLEFYCEGRHINNPDLKGSISHTMRFASSPDIETLKVEAARKVVPAFHKLESLDLTEDTVGKEWQSYESYIEIMSRRIKETVGLQDEPEGGQDGDTYIS
ncbi:nucleoporin Nup186/Nup192/Nup205 [Fomitopsis serialis]|uniref:nucleoporin Nup186/Nup192/Nup205 n=1 Tax=Fomitopsis serialis TaxID=139415 RepID=UPI002007E901|nr:nucleoporin Nup186/Nup192/Nup205 [Neoantrodia serialis]KAH9929472.1 nucleoporin Nup186/Nup192/Nup205 [Neoantrodia serialis]